MPSQPPPECVIGVDLGGTKLLAGAVDRALHVTARLRCRPATTDTETLIDAVAAAVAEVAANAPGPVRAVGVGIPCLVDARGVAVSSVHLPVRDVAFAQRLGERTGLPTFVENDANLALLAEHRAGAARGADEALMLTLGTGIGGAIVSGGRLRRGARGLAGEAGHMIVAGPDGPDCGPGCPSRGCLESVASGTALVRAARAAAARHPTGALAAHAEEIDGPLVSELAAAGDPQARELLDELGGWLGLGLTSLVNIFDPEVIVVGGGVIGAGELLLAPARAVVAARALGPGAVRLVAAHFGAESGMLGGAVLAYDSLDRTTP